MLARRIPAVASVWERFWEVMPFAGPVRRQFARLEMADTLSAAVAGNGDLLEALELGYQSCRSPHLRQRLGVCVAAVKRGEPWAAAWEAAGLGAPFQYWILRNAAARQDPFSGFILLRDWLAEDVDRRVKRLCLWIEPCMTCLNSALFAFVIFAFWNPMMYLIFECMKT
jgi:type II secretory pathway component PulF